MVRTDHGQNARQLDCEDKLPIKCRSTANNCFGPNEDNAPTVSLSREVVLVKYLTSKVNWIETFSVELTSLLPIIKERELVG